MRIVTLALLLGACAATGDAGGGASHLPVSGAGPFRPLDPESAPGISAPYVLSDPVHDLDDASFVVRGEQIAAWVTVRSGPRDAFIGHADVLTRIEDGFGPLVSALEANQGWEAGAVSAPSIMWDGGREWLLFYSGGGAIGWAVGVDDLGHVWKKTAGPALIADGLEEGNLLDAPAAVRFVRDDGSDVVRVYYLGAGAIWAAEAPYADLFAGNATTWTRLDGDPSTPARDPMLAPGAAPFAPVVGRIQARAGETVAGRVRHDLYFGASGGTPPSTCGFAASFTGDHFAAAPLPILPHTTTTSAAHAPAESPYRDGALLLYTQPFGGRSAIAAALSP